MKHFRHPAGLALAALLALAPLAAQEQAVAEEVAAEPAPATEPVPLRCTGRHGFRHGEGPVLPAPLARAAPVQDYEPAPAMWRLSDEDTTITIFGTFHVLPEGFRWRTPLFDRVAGEAQEVVFESRDDQDDAEAKLTPEALRFMTLMLRYRPSEPLSARLSEPNRPKLKRMLQLAGLSADQIEYAPPMIAMFAIAEATAEAEGSLRDFGVETVIEAEFKASGRPISAIEDPIQVMENLFGIDEAQLIAMIDEGFDGWDGCALVEPGATDWETEHNWAQGKLGDEAIAEMLEDPFGRAFYQVLLVDRNRAWTEWLAERMARPGNLLLAVGAGHMEGPDSVILMLQEKGFKIERIQ